MEKKFCYRCMENYDGFRTVCPHCGYDENSSYNDMYLAPGTILHERYLVGVLLDFNGEGATYIAYDKVIGCKVLLREYMPINLCSRVTGKPTISVNYNNLAKYKAFMAEYTELNKSLARLRNNTNINSTLDMFAENNTTYTIFEYIEGFKLLDYLKENAGELTWEQVSKLFPPLFTTIGILHNAGIIHRAISPRTVYVTSKGEIKLFGFCISSVRTIGGGLETELFKGYAAPEQYSSSSSSRQGTWTDVYGLSALLYRILTGCMPTESTERVDSDNLCEPCMLNTSIPKHVSHTIMDGMNLSSNNRIQTVTELVTRLFEQVEEPQNYATKIYHGHENLNSSQNLNQNTYTRTNYIPNNNVSQHQNYNNNYNNLDVDVDVDDEPDNDVEYETVSTIDKIKIPLIIGILLVAILMILGVTLMNVLSPQSGKEESSGNYASMSDNIIEATTEEIETTTEEVLDGIVPDVIGKFYELTKEKYENFIVLEAEYEYNDEYEEGRIFWQDFEAGSGFKIGSVMKVKVSNGSATTEIPDYDGYTVDEYKILLSNAGISYNLIEMDSYDATPNTVIKLEINGDTVYAGDRLDNSKDEQLDVYYQPKYESTTELIMTTVTTEIPTVTTVTTVTEEIISETSEYIEPTEPTTEEPETTEPDIEENTEEISSEDETSTPDDNETENSEEE